MEPPQHTGWYYLPKTLNRATSSILLRCNGGPVLRLENSIFNAVPTPCTYRNNKTVNNNNNKTTSLACSFPHNLHLSQPTQSMMWEIFLKWDLKASYYTDDTEWHHKQMFYCCMHTFRVAEELPVNIIDSSNRLEQLLDKIKGRIKRKQLRTLRGK